MNIFIIFLFNLTFGISSAIASMQAINWQKISLLIPESWNGVQAPMPSLHGYFLNTTIYNKPVRFFVHAHKPLSIATDKLAQDYWNEFLGNKDKNSICKNISNSAEASLNFYQCSYITQKKDDNSKWVLQTMFWLSDTERLLIASENFDTKKEAQNVLDNLEAKFQ